ncbi:TlpA family protein disulfide reductase [Pedobacter metabolipauper]|uniref:TlpA family protein disulfide reductase n=1 Tax=Pedobacter metabolipauper TaxID=425513 RepID=UPI0014152076|nr:TlpA disulfide reductase family protein [Pedobacter metabolipauper]
MNTYITKASNVKYNQIDSTVRISGHITKDSDPIDSIRVIYKHEYLFGVIDKNTSVYTVYPTNTGNFTINLKSSKELGKISQMVFYFHDDHVIAEEYLVRYDDNIDMSVSRHGDNVNLVFDGFGKDKYTCRREVELIYATLLDQYIKIYSSRIMKEPLLIDSLNRIWSKALTFPIDDFKNKISEHELNVLRADALAKYPIPKRGLISIAYNSTSSTHERKIIAQSFLSDFSLKPSFDDSIYSLSYKSLENMFMNLQDYIVYSRGNIEFSISDVFNLIKSNFSGDLRERLYLQLLINPKYKRFGRKESSMDYELCLKEAYDNSRNLIIKNEFLQRLSTVLKGQDAYNFSLPNTNGDTVKLSDFKGKVVILDIWYTGCIPCREFSQRMEKEVYPKFRKNSDFSVISVSIDKTKVEWLKSVKAGLYTSGENINLYTDGLQSYHPLLKKYGVMALPFLLMIDKKGRIYSRLNNLMSSSDIDILISAALKHI